jgi:hypothetical protein
MYESPLVYAHMKWLHKKRTLNDNTFLPYCYHFKTAYSSRYYTRVFQMNRLSTLERHKVEGLWIQTGDVWNFFNESKRNTRCTKGFLMSSNSGLACWFNYIKNTMSDKRDMVQHWSKQSLFSFQPNSTHSTTACEQP